MSDTERNSHAWLILLAILLAALALLALPTQLPRLEQVQPRAHAVQNHGADALTARDALHGCPPQNLRVKLCPPSSCHPLSVVFYCETGGSLCPGMYATIGGVERTAFIRPCDQWRNCR